MTVCVALKRNNEVYIGTDTLGSSMISCQNYGEKLIYNKHFILAFAGSYRGAQVIEKNIDFIKGAPRNKKDVIDIAEYFRILHIKAGIPFHGAEGEFPSSETTMLLATKDEIYIVESNYQVLVPEAGYATEGSGSYISMGVIYGLLKGTNKKISTKKIVEHAINSAIEHVPSCGGKPCIRKVVANNLRYRQK